MSEFWQGVVVGSVGGAVMAMVIIALACAAFVWFCKRYDVAVVAD